MKNTYLLLLTISTWSIIKGTEIEDFHTLPQESDQFEEYKWKVKHVSNQLQKTDENKNGLYRNAATGRTFGIRRLKMAIPAIMYKLGVLTTMMGFLTLIAVKGLLIGAVLLIFQLSKVLAKFHALKGGYGEHKPPQNIHVHVHGTSGPGHHYTYSHGETGPSYEHGPYSGWAKSDSSLVNKLDANYYYNKYKELRDNLYLQEVD